MKVVIINPTYNEKGNIEKLIPILEDEVFPKIKNHEMHILVADDTSPDGTADEVSKLREKYKNLHLLTGPKHGLGAAYLRAMDYAIKNLNADILFEMDADFFHDPYKIPEFLQKIDEGYDVVIGTRYSGGGSIPKNWALNRKLLSIVGNFVVRTVFTRFSIHDWTGGYRALRKEVFLKEKEKIGHLKGYRFQVGFLHKIVQDGFRVAEVPFHATDRTSGRSKMARGETIVDTLKYVFHARFLELARFIKFLIVGTSGFLVQVSMQELSIGIGLATIIALALQNMGVEFGHSFDEFSHGIGAAIGAEAAIISNFTWNNIWTFQDTRQIKKRSHVLIRFLKFNMTSFGAILIQALAVFFGELAFGHTVTLFSYTLPVRILVLPPAIVLLVIPLNYFIYNKIIWKTQHLKHGKNPQT